MPLVFRYNQPARIKLRPPNLSECLCITRCVDEVVDRVRRCTVYTTVYSIAIHPRPEFPQSTDNLEAVQPQFLGQTHDIRIVEKVRAHLDPVAGHQYIQGGSLRLGFL